MSETGDPQITQITRIKGKGQRPEETEDGERQWSGVRRAECGSLFGS